jgi:hypothetical protein
VGRMAKLGPAVLLLSLVVVAACSAFGAASSSDTSSSGGSTTSSSGGDGGVVVGPDGGGADALPADPSCVDYIPFDFSLKPPNATVDFSAPAAPKVNFPALGASATDEERAYYAITLPNSSTLADYARVRLEGTFLSTVDNGFSTWGGSSYVTVAGLVAGTIDQQGTAPQISVFFEPSKLWMAVFPDGSNNTATGTQDHPVDDFGAMEMRSFSVDVPVGPAAATTFWASGGSMLQETAGIPSSSANVVTVFFGGSVLGPTTATHVTVTKLCVAFVRR